MNHKNEKKIYDFFNKDFINHTSNIAIFKNQDGSYELFNRYEITGSKNDGYVITIKHSFTSIFFYSLKNAVTWCIFEKRNKIYESNRIVHLDHSLNNIKNMRLWHKKLLKNTKNIDRKMVYLAKLSFDCNKYNNLLKELNEFTTTSKFWQTQVYNAQK